MQLRTVALFSVLTFCITACGVSPTGTGAPDDQSAAERPILNGFDAKSPSLNAIGTVGLYSADIDIYSYWCTGTLISPTLVLTAKHCAVSPFEATAGASLLDLTEIHIAFGADVTKPAKFYQVVAIDLSPVNEGGFIKQGNDVAVMHLAEPVLGVTPIAVADAPFTSADLGRRFAAVGYGSKTAEEAAYGTWTGKRSLGQVTVHALEGQSYVALFGSWEKYYAFMVWLYGEDTVEIAIDIIKGWWNDMVILPGYELHAGGQPGDGQLCFGDDGAPLIGQEGGVKKVFGVASNSWFTPASRCGGGTFFAIIGPKTREMLDAALHGARTAAPRVAPAVKITSDDIRRQIEANLTRHDAP